MIAVRNERAGELPKAFIVKSNSVGLEEENDAIVKRDIGKSVEKQKARHKWLAAGIEFIDIIPKSPSGKILRRLLRAREREAGKTASPKL